MRVLSQALSRADAKGYCRNWAAAALVNRPVGSKPRFTVITPELASTILGAATGRDPWDAAVHLGLGLGLRREEVLALRWSDVGDTVTVQRALTAAHGELHFGPPKSEAGEREIVVPDFVAKALRRHRKAQAERLLAIGLGSCELVVDNGAGEPWFPATFSTYWRSFAIANGFEGVRFHDLRRGAATFLLMAEVPDAVALAVMGHSDVKMLRHYQEVADTLKQDAADRMNALLGT